MTNRNQLLILVQWSHQYFMKEDLVFFLYNKTN